MVFAAHVSTAHHGMDLRQLLRRGLGMVLGMHRPATCITCDVSGS